MLPMLSLLIKIQQFQAFQVRMEVGEGGEPGVPDKVMIELLDTPGGNGFPSPQGPAGFSDLFWNYGSKGYKGELGLPGL